MKLIDLLVKELPRRGGWPEGAESVVQDAGDSGFYFFTGGPVKNGGKSWWFVDSDSRNDNSKWIFFEGKNDIADDCNSAIVTRAQYEAALAASDDWIEWHGGKCPVDSDAIIEVKYRSPNPYQYNNDRAGDFTWSHDGFGGDIIAYRLQHPGFKSRTNDDRLERDLNECIAQDVVTEWDGDGLPPAGCECEARYRNANAEWAFFRCVVVDCGVAFGWSGKEAVTLGIDSYEFRPLRTEAEMARDKLAASLHIAAGASPIELNGIGPLYFKLADAIISGSVFGTTFKAGK